MALKLREIRLGDTSGLVEHSDTPRAAQPDWPGWIIVDDLGRQYDCTGGLNSSRTVGHTVYLSWDLAEAVLRGLRHLSGK